MSKINALITTLVLGASSVAMADSSVSFHGTAQASWGSSVVAPVVRDHRTSLATYQAPRPRGTWIALSEPMKLARGRGVLDINARMPLNQIRLQSASGQAFISMVTVQYVNGASQVVTVNQWIDSRNPIAQFNLNRTAVVDSIQINGSRGMRSGRFQVFGYAASTRPEGPVYTPPIYQPPVPVTIAASMNFARTDGYRRLAVTPSTRFSTLRLAGVSGQTFISKIEIQFANGQTQSLHSLNRTLLAGQSFDLALQGSSPISQLLVFTNDTLTPVPSDVTGELTISAL